MIIFIRNIIERSNTFRFPFYRAIVDYEEVFESVSWLIVTEELNKSNIDSGYIPIIGNIYKKNNNQGENPTKQTMHSKFK